MSVPEKKLAFTFEAFMALEEKAEYKSEFFQGEIFAMSGGTRDHSLIGTNIARELGNALRSRECYVFNSDLMVRIEEANAGFYPDAMVVCGKEQYADERKRTITNPTAVFEVLSESTAAWDHGGKFRQYQMLPTLQEYVLAEQVEPQVNVYRRRNDGTWLLEGYSGLETAIELKSLDVRIPMNEIYLGIDFSPATA